MQPTLTDDDWEKVHGLHLSDQPCKSGSRINKEPDTISTVSRPKQQFGGGWTAEKLERVRKYLVAYAKRDLSAPDTVMRTLVAFANGAGGASG